eukprot:6102374-Prymnesium_polylepis.1
MRTNTAPLPPPVAGSRCVMARSLQPAAPRGRARSRSLMRACCRRSEACAACTAWRRTRWATSTRTARSSATRPSTNTTSTSSDLATRGRTCSMPTATRSAARRTAASRASCAQRLTAWRGSCATAVGSRMSSTTCGHVAPRRCPRGFSSRCARRALAGRCARFGSG